MAVTLRRSAARPSLLTADCPSGALVGDMVAITADRIGGIYQVGLCDITQAGKRAAGMVVAKQSPTRCTVQRGGEVAGLYTGLTPGRPVFLGLGTGARLVQLVPPLGAYPTLYHERAGLALAGDVISLDIEPATKRVSN